MNKNWTPCKIMDLIAKGEAELKTGPFGTQLHASDYVETGTPVINVRNVGFGSIREDNLEFISEETVQRLRSHLLEAEDIVFGRKGAVERHAFIEKKHVRWFQGSDCLRLRIKSSRIVPRFLSYYFQTEAHKQWMIKQCSHGSTMASLNQDIISRISFPLPSPQTQHKIAAILSAYDDLIENNTRRIAILEEMAQTIYQEWFVHFRYPGHEKNTMVESDLGMIPEGWEVKNLGDLCEITMGQSPSSQFYNENEDGLPFHQGVTDFGEYFPTTRIYCTVQNRLAKAGDILFSVRAPVGRINIALEKIVIGRGVSAIRSKTENQIFILYQIKDLFQKEDIIGNGAIFQSVTKNDMYNIKLRSPSLNIVSSFEKYIQPVFKNIEFLTRKNHNLRNTRNLLLPKLISGEIDVETLDIDIPDMPETEAQQQNTAPIVQPEPIDASQLAFLF